jgi:alanyl-tRNA synthetase
MPTAARHAVPSTDKSSEEIRADFLSFFEERGHTVVESAPIAPRRDPTLLFTNAGMNQFKDVFLGEGTREYALAVDTQKCLRVSGKHNDLDEVGHDTYHHTFFEMLGNWSFGGSGESYFKKEAVGYAWALLVGEWGLPPERLYATVHEGDDALGLGPDEEAAECWTSETGIDSDHILFDTSKENFWTMGDTGPCGPCSEVHVDLRSERARRDTPGRELVNEDHPQVMEIWNLVFIQYDAQPDGTIDPLPEQHVDTGMGFERLVAVLQGRESTYDTDLFQPLLQQAADLSPRAEVRGYDDIDVDDEDEEERERVRVALRAVADHLRAVGFAIADGVAPGNEGRAYVIRRIARRAVRYGYQALGMREPFLCRMVSALAEKMGDAFPQLIEQEEYLRKVLRSEEEGFLDTLSDGIAFFEQVLPYVKELAMLEEEGLSEGVDGDALDQVETNLREDRSTLDLLRKAYRADGTETVVEALSQAAARREVPGEVAFLLHDTYGFPVDLTRLMAREEGLGLGQERYDELMREQRTRAREASDFSGAAARRDAGAWQAVREGDATNFVGYDQLVVEDARLLDVRTLDSDDGGERHEVVLDRTPFYAEGGGQVGDRGTLRVGEGDEAEEIAVLDAQHEGERLAHRVERLPEDLEAPITASVDAERRRRTAAHHTATHLLHAVLRRELGTHVQQKGSLVTPERLRFDFSHYEQVAPEMLDRIEAEVNAAIQRNIARQEERDVPLDEARERGALMFFGEAYGERVRVITFDPDFSMELCGGTHAGATGELGLFKVLSEESVASGVRRIEAVAGPAALGFVEGELEELGAVRAALGQTQTGPAEAVTRLLDERDRLEEEIEEMKRSRLQDRLGAIAGDAEDVAGVRLAVGRFPEAEMDALREMAQELGQRLGDGAVAVLGAPAPGGDKVYVACHVAEDVTRERGLKAGDLVGELGQRLGGGGGGRPGLASAGGRDPGKLGDVLADVPRLARERLREG